MVTDALANDESLFLILMIDSLISFCDPFLNLGAGTTPNPFKKLYYFYHILVLKENQSASSSFLKKNVKLPSLKR